MLGGTYRSPEVRFNIRRMTENGGGEFVPDRVVRVVPERRRLLLAGGEELGYDVVSFNTGSGVRMQAVAAEGEGIITVKPVENLLRARQVIGERLRRQPLRLLVVGGGPAGVEVAGNLWRLADTVGGRTEIVLAGGGEILTGLPAKARRLAGESLRHRQVAVHEEARAERLTHGSARFTDGTSLDYDYAFVAVGIEPSAIFRDSDLPVGADGGLLVDEHLRSVRFPEIFGGGDCISFAPRPLDKVGVYAVRQNPVLFTNLLAALEGGEQQSFRPQEDYLLIFNLGDGRGVFRRKKLVFDGRPAFLLKDRIDRRFMQRFQVSGERQEPEETI